MEREEGPGGVLACLREQPGGQCQQSKRERSWKEGQSVEGRGLGRLSKATVKTFVFILRRRKQ